MAASLLGQVLLAGGAAGQALPTFQEAQGRFETLGEAGARMAAATLTEQGNCLQVLGRLEEAAQAYQRAIDLDEQHGRARDVAAGKGNLATVRMYQGRHAEALAAYESARQTFVELGEPQTVAVFWHQIGMAHQGAGNDEAAEETYREALALSVQLNDRAGEASTLGQLGNLYKRMGRLEEAVAFYRQAADVYVQLVDQASKGRARSNLAITLIVLRRYDPARAEIVRAIACKEPYGHAAEPWTSWDILHDLERAAGDGAAAQRARGEARRLYLAYRRDGGENQSGHGRLCAALAQAVRAGQVEEMAATLQQVAVAWKDDEFSTALVSTLQAILAGSREPALVENPVLNYAHAAEVQLLLERLGG